MMRQNYLTSNAPIFLKGGVLISNDEVTWSGEEPSGTAKTRWMEGIYSNLHNKVLGECQVNVLKALINEVGAQQTLEILKPVNIFAGKIIAGMVRQSIGIQGNDVVSVAMPYYVAHYGTSRGNIKPMEIRDGKAIIELYACPGVPAGGPPEMCIQVSHYLAMGMCEAVNPEYEFVFTHHLLNGDNCCRYIVKKKSDKFSLDNPGRLEKTIPIELPQSDLDMWVEMEEIGGMGNSTWASVESIGSQRLLQITAPYHNNSGLKMGDRIKKEAGGKSDLSTLREGADLVCRSVHETNCSAQIINDTIEKEIDCPFKPYFPTNLYNVPPVEVCMQLEGVSKSICNAINPDYEFTLDRMMSKGDPKCHWVVKKKSATGGAKPQESIQDDSLGY